MNAVFFNAVISLISLGCAYEILCFPLNNYHNLVSKHINHPWCNKTCEVTSAFIIGTK